MPEFAVELRNVVKLFPNPGGGIVRAVDDISLRVRDGEFFSMLGPSGCGKTTSLRMIAGFEYPSSGSILIRGKDVSSVSPFKRPVNTVFQNYALFPHMTVGDNVGFGLEMKGIPKTEIRSRVQETLEKVRLSGMESRMPNQLSGGQQQRVAVARAIINLPQVLLLDEPLGALDLKLRKAMQLELKSLQRELGITFIYVTHDQEEAMTMSDRIVVMRRGRALQVGTPEEIYEEPASRYVADFIGETNFLEGIVKSGKGKKTEVEIEGGLLVHSLSRASLNKGIQVSVAVRPERIMLNSKKRVENRFRGRVTEVVYIGTDRHYDVLLAGDQHVRVREQNADPSPQVVLKKGSEVSLSFSAEAARVLVE